MFRTTFCIFLALAILFFAAAVALHHWGGHWARAAYEPILAERVVAACAQQQHGEAEGILLQALRSSPAYARFVQDLAAADLVVMPQLKYALAGTPRADAPLPPYDRFSGQTDIDTLSPYKQALALMATGHSGDAPSLFEDPALEPRALPDAAFHLGRLRETGGDERGALPCYVRALTLCDTHLDAAHAYLRLAGSTTPDR
jgi:hypothetical protein